MKTTLEHLTVIFPFLHKEKNTYEQKELENRIKDETEDLNRIASKRPLLNPLKKRGSSVYSFFESTLTKWIDKLHSIKANLEYDSSMLKDLQLKYLDYVLPNHKRAEIIPKLEKRSIEEQEQNLQTKSTAISEKTNLTPRSGTSEIPAHFTHANTAPIYGVLEAQQLQTQVWYGDHTAETYFPKDVPEDAIDVEQKVNEPLTVSDTFLSKITGFKVALTYLIVFAGLIPEYLIYSKIVGSIFHFEGFKLYVSGVIVLLISKTMSILILQNVHDFFRELNPIFHFLKLKISRYYFIIFCTGFIYCICIGVLYNQYTEEEQLTKSYVILQHNNQQLKEETALEASSDANTNQQIVENEKELKQLREKITNRESGLLKTITIALSNGIVLLFSSLLFAMAWVFAVAYKLRVKTNRYYWRATSHFNRFFALKNRVKIFRQKAKRIFALHGELQLLKKLEQDGSPKEVLFHPKETDKKSQQPLPLNGTPKKHENLF